MWDTNLGQITGFDEVKLWGGYVCVGLLNINDDWQVFVKHLYQPWIEVYARKRPEFLEGFLQWPGVFVTSSG